MANVNDINSTKRQPSKSDASAASQNDVPKPRLLACSKMEVHKKEVDNKRLKIRQKYGKITSELETRPRTFVTKVQIKSKKPAFEDDKIRVKWEHKIQNPPSISSSQEFQSKSETENESGETPAKNATSDFPKNRLIPSAEDSIDLLWADEYCPVQEKQEYLEINKLIHHLSRRQRESSTLLSKIPQRPTASFARPTKGEISLWMKSAANKSNAKNPFLTGPRDQDSIRPRSRAWSLPLYRFHSPSTESMRFEQSQCQCQCLEIRRPSSVPIKQISPR
ncbi:uncharacterized protein LOC116298116 [Actinia tenebrosa]|uniref:Uncharacterized protein LOC116298116 n=1 Tax=Actinia tenebrosa TaxID=6105 RepID=A0A6P8I3C5_ACTTE|nr:uncharacterized protein LOC116298116 [Actinia tenebrosa]